MFTGRYHLLLDRFPAWAFFLGSLSSWKSCILMIEGDAVEVLQDQRSVGHATCSLVFGGDVSTRHTKSTDALHPYSAAMPRCH